MAKLGRDIRKAGISNRVDDSSATIGKRYSRNDELGTPFGITVDFRTLEDGTVTLRERDGMKQIRGSQSDMVRVVKGILDGSATWEEALNEFKDSVGQEVEEE